MKKYAAHKGDEGAVSTLLECLKTEVPEAEILIVEDAAQIPDGSHVFYSTDKPMSKPLRLVTNARLREQYPLPEYMRPGLVPIALKKVETHRCTQNLRNRLRVLHYSDTSSPGKTTWTGPKRIWPSTGPRRRRDDCNRIMG